MSTTIWDGSYRTTMTVGELAAQQRQERETLAVEVNEVRTPFALGPDDLGSFVSRLPAEAKEVVARWETITETGAVCEVSKAWERYGGQWTTWPASSYPKTPADAIQDARERLRWAEEVRAPVDPDGGAEEAAGWRETLRHLVEGR